ncbi:Pleiotropic regulator 1 [Paramecium bursaria]
MEDLQPIFTTIEDLCLDSVLSSRKLFECNEGRPPPEFYESLKLKLNCKVNHEYKAARKQNDQIAAQLHQSAQEIIPKGKIDEILHKEEDQQQQQKLPSQFAKFQEKTNFTPTNTYLSNERQGQSQNDKQLVSIDPNQQKLSVMEPARLGTVLVSKIKKIIKPDWHAPWKLMRVISGHHGWVRCISVDPANQFFVTGSSDRTIKFWDLATGNLKITYTGHISTIRGVIVSPRHPYLFSCAEDKTVKCWDLEQNKMIRDYHGHLSGVYCIALHPTLDVIVTGGRDSVCRVWDIRARQQIHVLEGHTNTVDSIICQEFEPQIVSGSQDSMIRLWDISMGKCISSLTNHKKSVRSMQFHPNEYTFCSGASDNIKIWKCPEGTFLRNVSGHNAMINSISISKYNVLASAADNGSLYFWDWKSGYNYQQINTIAQPGSIAAENGIFCTTFDQSQTRFLTGECDKTIKVYKEDENATPESHPIDDFRLEFQNY